MASARTGHKAEHITFGEQLRGYLAHPAGPGPYAAVVLLHERYGLFQHTLDLAEQFAASGYVCLAPDLYSRVEDQSRLRTGEIRISLPDPQVRGDLNAGFGYLKDLPLVDSERLGLMGVCMTGRYAITVGAYRDDLRALMVFYGGAAPKEWEVNEFQPESLSDLFPRVNAPVLGVFGEADHTIPLSSVLKFREHLERANKSYEIKLYADMPHGWLNSRMPGRYRAGGAAEAWGQLTRFLERAFGDGYPRDRVQWEFESDVSTSYDPSQNVRLE